MPTKQHELMMMFVFRLMIVLSMVNIFMIVMTYMKHKEVVTTHAVGNKISGFLFFLIPLAIVIQVVIAEKFFIVLFRKAFGINRK